MSRELKRHLKAFSKNEKGQMLLLSGFIIVIGLITYTSLLNEMIFTTNTPQTGQDLSKNDIKQLRALIVGQAQVASKFALYKNATGDGDVAGAYRSFMNPLVNATSAYYVGHGASVEIELNSINNTNNTASLLPSSLFVRDNMAPHTFSNQSIIIPMDDNQKNIMPVYGLIWNLTNDFDITVYQLIQDSRGEAWWENANGSESYTDFDIRIETNNTAFDNSSIGANITTYRDYAGGPYIIDYVDLGVTNSSADDPDETVEDRLEGFNNGTYNFTSTTIIGTEYITMHRIWEGDFEYDKVAAIDEAPRIGIWPPNDTYESNTDAMNLYYAHSGVQNYTFGSNNFSESNYTTGDLYDYDIIMIPHSNMSAAWADKPAIRKLVMWVKNGGVLYVEGMGVASMDYAAQEAKEMLGEGLLGFAPDDWYGFIGVIHSNGTGANVTLRTNMTFIGVSTIYDTSNKYQYYNETAKNDPMADPGSAFNPLAQTYAPNGNLIITSGHTQAFIIVPDEPALNEWVYAPECEGFTLGSNVTSDNACYPSIEKHNPDINIIAVPTNNNQSYINRTTYVEAKFGDGTVIYLGSDNQTEGGEQRERLVFNTLFSSVLRERGIFAIRDINFTIRYTNGNTHYNTTIGIESMS